MKRFVKSIGISILIIGVLSACSGQTVEKSKTSESTQKKVDKTTEKPAEKQKDKKETMAQIGDTLDVSGVKITLTSIDAFTGAINQFEPLKADHAVKIGVIVENTTKDKVFVDNTEFKLYDTEGFELKSALPSDEDSLSAEIPGGKKVQGAIFFDVPKQTGNWEVHYESMASFNGEPAIWEVQAK